MQKIILGSDHGGYALKEFVKTFLLKKGCVVEDAGPGDECLERVDAFEGGLYASLGLQCLVHRVPCRVLCRGRRESGGSDPGLRRV